VAKSRVKPPAPKVGSPSDDLISRGMLPDVPTIKPGAGFGDDIKTKKPGGKYAGGRVKKMSNGGSASSRADGCAVKGKTRGKFV